MEKVSRPNLSDFYDKIYKNNTNYFDAGEPENFILEASEMIPKDAEIIEFGAGQGRNSLFLAEK